MQYQNSLAAAICTDIQTPATLTDLNLVISSRAVSCADVMSVIRERSVWMDQWRPGSSRKYILYAHQFDMDHCNTLLDCDVLGTRLLELGFRDLDLVVVNQLLLRF